MRKRLLDWKLEFVNPQHERKYGAEFNQMQYIQHRATLVFGVLQCVFPIIIGYCLRGRFYYGPYSLLITPAVWAVGVIPIFVLLRKYAGLLTCYAIFGSCCSVITTNLIVAYEYDFNPLVFFVSFYFLLQPFVLRLMVRHFSILCTLLLIIHIIVTFTSKNLAHTTTAKKFGDLLAPMFYLCMCLYYGYFFEKRWKYDFFRREMVAEQSTQLRWDVARDASLLRNIFPKCLSDELSMQMAKQKSTKNPGAEESSEPTPMINVTSFKRTRSEAVQLFTNLSPELEVATQPLDGDTALLRPMSRLVISGPLFSSQEIPSSPKATVIAIPPLSIAPLNTLNNGPDFNIPNTVRDSRDSVLNPVNRSTSIHPAELHSFLNGANHNLTEGTRIALSHYYPNVTVIFADIVGFTTLSSTISPSELVALLNNIFSRFDDITDSHDLEKIRTVGDAYLCVGNMSIAIDNHESEAVKAALEMIAAVRQIQSTLSLRVGIASGPLIAGVTGITKWNYDIFGKTVTNAITMETLAPHNQIAVSASIYNACKNNTLFNFECPTDKENAAEEFYIMKADVAADAAIIVKSDDDNFAILAHTSTALLRRDMMFDEALSAFELAQSDQEAAAVLEFDPTKKFNYSKVDLEREEAYIDKKKGMTFSFLRKDFEFEFRLNAIKAIHCYTGGISIFLALSLLIYQLIDLSQADPLPAKVLVTYNLAIFLCLLYLVFQKYYDYHRTANYVALAVINIYLFSLVAIFWEAPTCYRLMWLLLSELAVASFVRVPVLWLMISQIIYVIVVVCVVSTSNVGNVNISIFVPNYVLVFGLSITSQKNSHSSLRKQFLAKKMLVYDLFHQKLAQHRTKLLLHNILPEEIIPRIKTTDVLNSGVVDLFEQASMMFINFTNLAELTAELDATNTFQVYNDLFILCDEITQSFGLEKIKTINTVYMVAIGLPKEISNHADVGLQYAAEIYKAVSKFSVPHVNRKFTVRVGMASGPVVAGIIGKKKYAYDCWSDTTNTASRMESNGWDGHIQITGQSYNLLQDKSHFEKRENLYIKGKGIMDTYILALANR